MRGGERRKSIEAFPGSGTYVYVDCRVSERHENTSPYLSFWRQTLQTPSHGRPTRPRQPSPVVHILRHGPMFALKLNLPPRYLVAVCKRAHPIQPHEPILVIRTKKNGARRCRGPRTETAHGLSQQLLLASLVSRRKPHSLGVLSRSGPENKHAAESKIK